MISKTIFVIIGIAVGVFFVGISSGYVIFSYTYNSDTMFQNSQMSNQMMQNPQAMQNMMEPMMNEPQLRQQMYGIMFQNQQFMQNMMNNSQFQSQWMSPMMGNSIASDDVQFNVKTQITLPMLNGYHNGKEVHFVHTEVSDPDIAQRMTMMTNFPTKYVSDLSKMSADPLSNVYVFTNGIPGDGPYIGGPFMYQIDVFDSIPGDADHTQFKIPSLVTWNEDSEPRILTSVEEIMKAKENGELSITKSELVVNMPMVTWYDGEKQEIEHIISPYVTVPGYDVMVVNIDEKNGLLSLKFHAPGQMNMMN